jgi:hypothetical protein
MEFITKEKRCDMSHVWNKRLGFIHYNVQFVMFIVAYSTN